MTSFRFARTHLHPHAPAHAVPRPDHGKHKLNAGDAPGIGVQIM
jgi:hypothetical protein